MSAANRDLEANLWQLTAPINGQFPRPWMSDLEDPSSAAFFIVGKNQAKGYSVNHVTHQRHIDSLFNRNGQSCRGLYDELTGGTPSPTRKNIDTFRSLLASHGVDRVLETNVICYSTPMSEDLRLTDHAGGSARGTEIFQTLFRRIRPRVLVAHGSGTGQSLGALLGVKLPAPPSGPSDLQPTLVGGCLIFIIPSLAPPKWNQWCKWAPQHLAKVAEACAGAL